jgi:hypothetical protein
MYEAGGIPAVKRRIEVSYVEPDEGGSPKRLSSILADGVFGYLKGRGLLRQDAQRAERVERLLHKAKELAGLREELETEDSGETS